MDADSSNKVPSTGVEFHDLGQALIDLGNNLRELGKLTAEEEPWDPREDDYLDSLDHADRIVYENQKYGKREGKMSQTLNGMRKFRSEYEHLERLIANYAMHDMNFSQRRTGTLLGYSGATMNRLSQATRDEDE